MTTHVIKAEIAVNASEESSSSKDASCTMNVADNAKISKVSSTRDSRPWINISHGENADIASSIVAHWCRSIVGKPTALV